jgi:hypothetical protein
MVGVMMLGRRVVVVIPDLDLDASQAIPSILIFVAR